MDERKKKIVIIEDDEHISRIYGMKFTKEGYDTVFVTSGEQAVEKIASEMPNLVILDLMMPKRDGFGVLEDIKKNPNLSKIPVLVISNLGQQSDRERATELGASDYMIKVNNSMQEVVDKAKSYL